MASDSKTEADNVKIHWKLKKNMPYGVEDYLFNILDGKVIVACGFGRTKMNRKLNMNGFTRLCFMYNPLTDKWDRITNYPAEGRQGVATIVVGKALYTWGGFAYCPMRPSILKTMKSWPTKKNFKSFDDGYKLIYNARKKVYVWTKLPSLPMKLTGLRLVTKDNKIYACCGAIADTHYGQLGVYESGKKMYVFDLNQENSQWRELSSLPGTPRYQFACFVHNDHIYVMGGIYCNNRWKYGDAGSRYISILDNWKYSISTNTWEQLSDCPYPLSGWSAGQRIIYKNKAILIGSSYRKYCFSNMKLIESNTLKTFAVDDKTPFQTCNFIVVYNIVNDSYKISPTKLPSKINGPGYQIIGNKIHLMGGEISQRINDLNAIKIHGRPFFGPHLCANLAGIITDCS